MLLVPAALSVLPRTRRFFRVLEGWPRVCWHEGAGAVFGLPLCVVGSCLSSWCDGFGHGVCASLAASLHVRVLPPFSAVAFVYGSPLQL